MIDTFAILEDLARRTGIDPAGLSVIQLNRSGQGQAAIAFLAFHRGRPEPLALVKATADADRAESLRREFANLSSLHRCGNETFRRSVPEPLYCERLDALTVLAEGARAGTRMKDFPPDKYFASKRFREQFTRVVDWLGQFHEAWAGGARAAREADAPNLAIERYRSAYDVSPGLSGLLDETLQALRGAAIPRPPSHGDFCTANLLVSEQDELFVIDWEHPLEPSWPFADLLHFVVSTWCIPYRKGQEAVEQNYRSMFFAPHSFSDLLRDSATRYAERIGVAADLMLPLSVISWVAHANRKQDFLSRNPGADGADHLPLVVVRDRTCRNLELLSEFREKYLLIP